MSRFGLLFSLRVSHAYCGGLCGDFAFVPSGAAQRRMRGGRLIARSADGVLSVLFEGDGAGEPVVPLDGQTLRFGLRPTAPGFGNITELGIDPAAEVLFYRNQADPAVLDVPVPLTVLGADPPVLEPELRQAGVLCLVEIRIALSFYDAPPVFEIAFAARSETLKYYLVARNHSPGDLDDLEISDEGSDDDDRPEILFTRVSAGAFGPDDIPAALLAGSDAGVVLFKSQDPVARQARGRRKIQLIHKGTPVIEHLPQPGAERPDADMIVHVSKQKQGGS